MAITPKGKTVPLSVRVTPDDARFIQDVEIPDADTPSDKVRALLEEARRRHESFRDYSGCLSMAQDLLGDTLQRLREAEHREEVHSELLIELAQWLPETVAYLLTGLAERDDHEQLHKFEAAVADRVFRLMENVLRMAVTRECHGYDPEVVARRMPPVIELIDVIRRKPEAETSDSRRALPPG